MNSPPAYDWIAAHCMATPDKRALVDADTGVTLTYRQLDATVDRIATFLSACGISAGDRISVIALNSPRTMELQFACARVGAIFNPINARLAVAELQYILDDIDPTIVIVDESTESRVAQALSGCTCRPSTLVSYDDRSSLASFDAVVDALDSTVSYRRHEASLDDPWSVIYTSGTTGRPKGSIGTHRMALYNAVNIGTSAKLTSNAVNLSVLPMFHTAGLNLYANPTFHAGGTVVVSRSFDPAAVLAQLTDSGLGITHFFGVPTHYEFMERLPQFDEARFEGLLAGVGGAAASERTLRTWSAKGALLMHGYGLTETSPSVTATPPSRIMERVGSVGLPLTHVSIRIVDDKGAEVPRGSVGELCVSGPVVTPGYWRKPVETSAAIVDGWLHTGDAVRQDPDGWIWIVGRFKDMYISGGENVYPAEVERVILEIENVAEVAVIGAKDERWGESGVAHVVLAAGADPANASAEIIRHCEKRLAKFKVPRTIIFQQQLPRTESGKVKKFLLREEAPTSLNQAANEGASNG